MTLNKMPRAPSIETSSSGDSMACWAACDGAVFAAGPADTHQGRAGIAHDGLNVSKVEVDQAVDGNQVGNTLHALAQDVVGDLKGFQSAAFRGQWSAAGGRWG